MAAVVLAALLAMLITGWTGAAGSSLPAALPSAVAAVRESLGGPLPNRALPGAIAQDDNAATAALMYELLRLLPAPPRPAPACPSGPPYTYKVTFVEQGRPFASVLALPGACQMVFLPNKRVLWASNPQGDALFSLLARMFGMTRAQLDAGR